MKRSEFIKKVLKSKHNTVFTTKSFKILFQSSHLFVLEFTEIVESIAKQKQSEVADRRLPSNGCMRDEFHPPELDTSDEIPLARANAESLTGIRKSVGTAVGPTKSR